MSLIKDYKEYKKLNYKYPINKLFLADIGFFGLASETTDNIFDDKVFSEFTHASYAIVEELTPAETKKHLLKEYGPDDDNLPRYQKYNRNSVRYFRKITADGKFLPLLNSKLMGSCRVGVVEAISDLKPLDKTFWYDMIEDEIDILTIKDLECATNEIMKDSKQQKQKDDELEI